MATKGHRPPEDGRQLRSKEFALDAFPLPSDDAPPEAAPPPPPPPPPPAEEEGAPPPPPPPPPEGEQP